MNRYSAFLIVFGVFLSLLGFLPAPNPLYQEIGTIYFRIAYWGLGPFCFGLALKTEIRDIQDTSESFQDKKRVLHTWTGPSSGKESEGGSQ